MKRQASKSRHFHGREIFVDRDWSYRLNSAMMRAFRLGADKTKLLAGVTRALIAREKLERKNDLYMNRRKPESIDDWLFLQSNARQQLLVSHDLCARARKSGMPHWFRCRVNRSYQYRKRRYIRISMVIKRMHDNLMHAIFGESSSDRNIDYQERQQPKLKGGLE